MRERAEMFGGTLAAGPRRGGGFSVRFVVPIPRASAPLPAAVPAAAPDTVPDTVPDTGPEDEAAGRDAEQTEQTEQSEQPEPAERTEPAQPAGPAEHTDTRGAR
jgi:hypothetical protein